MVSLEKNNVSFGILISAGVVFLCYIITIAFPIYFGTPGDIFVIPGTILGCYIAFKYRNENQTYVKLGLIIGIGGAILSTVLIALYYFLYYSFYYHAFYIMVFFYVIISIIIFYILFGFTTGYIMAMIYLRKEEKSKKTSTEIKGLDFLEEK